MKIPWYKQFWPWLVIALPMISVITSTSGAIIAFKGVDPLVSNQWYQDGVEINTFLEKDKQAESLKISAELTHDFHNEIIQVILNSNSVTPNSYLFLELEHPKKLKLDYKCKLKQVSGNIFQGILPQNITGRRYLILYPTDQSWRLVTKTSLPMKTKLILGNDKK